MGRGGVVCRFSWCGDQESLRFPGLCRFYAAHSREKNTRQKKLLCVSLSRGLQGLKLSCGDVAAWCYLRITAARRWPDHGSPVMAMAAGKQQGGRGAAPATHLPSLPLPSLAPGWVVATLQLLYVVVCARGSRSAYASVPAFP